VCRLPKVTSGSFRYGRGAGSGGWSGGRRADGDCPVTSGSFRAGAGGSAGRGLGFVSSGAVGPGVGVSGCGVVGDAVRGARDRPALATSRGVRAAGDADRPSTVRHHYRFFRVGLSHFLKFFLGSADVALARVPWKPSGSTAERYSDGGPRAVGCRCGASRGALGRPGREGIGIEFSVDVVSVDRAVNSRKNPGRGGVKGIGRARMRGGGSDGREECCDARGWG
jgi:hypothetical protein